MGHRTAQLASACCAVLLSSCGSERTDPFAQLSPSSPCYDIDLRDGFDDADELRTTFDCLDHHGHLVSLHPTVDALEADAQQGMSDLAVGLNLALDGLAAAGLSSSPSLPDPAVQDVLLELLTGSAGDAVGAPAPGHDAALWYGAGPALEVHLRELHDQRPAVAGAAALLRSADLEATVLALGQVGGQPQEPFVAPMLHHLAAAGVAGDPEGVLAEAFLDSWVVNPFGALPRSFFPLQLLTADASWRAQVTEAVAPPLALAEVPGSLAWLATVDAEGVPLRSGRVSALARILTLMDRGTAPVECTVGIEPFAIDLSFDDLTVRLLRIVAGMEPGTLGSASSVWSTLTDNVVADVALEAAVASGACPAFDTAALEGLDALDLLTAEEAAPLLLLLLPVLDTTERHQGLGHLASVLDAIGSEPSIQALDGLAARVASSDDAASAARGLQGLASPVPDGEPPLRHLLDGLSFALTGDATTEGPPAVVVYPWLRLVASDPEVRHALGRLLVTWSHPDSHVSRWLELVPEAEVTADGFRTVRALTEPEVVEPLLDGAAAPGVVSALLATEASAEGAAPPLVALEGALRAGAVSDALAFFEQAMDGPQR